MDDVIKIEWFGEVREKLLRIMKKAEQSSSHQFLDQVNEALSKERAFLFGTKNSFFVLRPEVKDGERTVCVMFGFGVGGFACLSNKRIVERLVKEIGAESVYLKTSQLRFLPLYKRLGYQVTDQVDDLFTMVKKL